MHREDIYKINGVQLKHPTAFKIEKYKITNAARLANGDMVADVLNHKRKFYFTYDAISAAELDKILELLWDNDEYFFDFEYVENGIAKQAIVYPGAIPAELHMATGSWVWKNVSFSLIEK